MKYLITIKRSVFEYPVIEYFIVTQFFHNFSRGYPQSLFSGTLSSKYSENSSLTTLKMARRITKYWKKSNFFQSSHIIKIVEYKK